MKKKEIQLRIEPDLVENLGKYIRCLPGFGDKIPIAVFKQYVKEGFVNDEDGYGYACKGDMITSEHYESSEIYDVDDFPTDATHVVWMNK